MKNLIEKSRKYAFDCHSTINQLYDDHPYSYHLEMVVDCAKKYIYYIPINKRDIVISGCYVHDVIEDCKINWKSVMKETNFEISILSRVLATGEGTRKERFSDDYYNGIKNTKYATFVKLCDRIANVQQGLINKNPVLNMYKKEHEHFKEMLYVAGEYEDMWKELDDLLS